MKESLRSAMYYHRVHGTLGSSNKNLGGIEMDQGLQAVNQRNQLIWWSQKVEECRKSGLKVAEWCAEHDIPVSTYYKWQRKVFQAVTERQEVCFAEVPIATPLERIAATIRVRNLSVEIHAGADSATIQAIIQALNVC